MSSRTRRWRTRAATIATAALLSAASVTALAPNSAAAVSPASVVQAAAAYGHAHRLHVAVSVYDTKTGQLYSGGSHTATFASESVVKTMIAARLLATGRMHGRTASAAYYMITHSDDAIASALYAVVGGDSLIDWVKRHWHVPDLGSRPHRAGWWGNTHITSDGLVRLYAKFKADPKVGPWLINAMHHAASHGSDGTYQFFGIPSATKGFGVKQGWGIDYDDWGASSDFNSTGFVNGDRYTIALLARGPASYYGGTIGGLLTHMARVVLPGGTFPSTAPVITSITHHSGGIAGGSLVTIYGAGLTHIRSVNFGVRPATSVRILSSRRLQVRTPAHRAGAAGVRIYTSHGHSERIPVFTFVRPPSVASLSSTTSPTHGGTVVTIHGSDFRYVQRVDFGGVAGAQVHVLSAGTLTVLAPAHSTGTVDVRVITPYGTSPVVPTDRFRYADATPTQPAGSTETTQTTPN